MIDGKFEQEILDVISARIRQRVAPLVENARKLLLRELDGIVAEEVATVSLSMARNIRVETMGTEFVIRVHMPERKK